MKKMALCAFLALFCSVSFVNANASFKLDDAHIDAMMADASDVSSTLSVFDFQGTQATLSNPNPWAASAICWFVGGFGVHRHYLGTSGSMWAVYTFTLCGIFGIVPIVDFVVLLIGAIQDDISKYVNNTSFFMW